MDDPYYTVVRDPFQYIRRFILENCAHDDACHVSQNGAGIEIGGACLVKLVENDRRAAYRMPLHNSLDKSVTLIKSQRRRFGRRFVKMQCLPDGDLLYRRGLEIGEYAGEP